MRLIIKPAGLVVIAVSIVALAGIALTKQNKGSAANSAASSTSSVVSPGTSSGPSEKSPSSKGNASEPSVTSKVIDTNGGGGTTGDVVVAASHEAELMPAPKLASDEWTSITSKDATTDVRVFPCTLPQFPKLKRVTVMTLPKNPWDVQLRQTAKGEIPLGAHVHVRLWARSKSSSPITIACEHNDKPYEKLASKTFDLSPDWKQYDMEWTSDRTAPPSWAQISLQLGGKVGEIELAGASLIASTSSPK